MIRFLVRRGVLALSVASALGMAMVAGPMAGGAQEATPVGDGPPIPANCTVVVSGLFNPRYVAVDADGTLYVTEAGDAGNEPFFAPAGEGTPESTEVITNLGPSGQVIRVDPDGAQIVITTGLPSYTFGSEVVGPAGITLLNGTLYVAVGGPGPATGIVPPAPNRDSVVAIDPTTGTTTTLADVGAYERSTNPDPNAVDSNLYGIAAGADGLLYVADAGGNAIYAVDPVTAELTVLAIIPGLPSPGGEANPARGGAAEIDPVPTGVTPAPDGGLYVGLLSGGPFLPGTAKVLHVAADGTVSDAATGLTMVAGVAVGPDGSIFASQISEDFLAQPPALGSVVRIGSDGAPETVVSGLLLPNGIAFGPDGSLYVVTNSTAPAGTPPQGQVLRCDVGGSTATPAAEEATPVASGSSQSAAAAAVAIDLVDLAFQPKEVAIAANADVTFDLTNGGFLPHNFTIDELDVQSANMIGGESTTLAVNAAAGSYTFYCSIPGHREGGMIGTLTVE